jgi:hypothetical protein
VRWKRIRAFVGNLHARRGPGCLGRALPNVEQLLVQSRLAEQKFFGGGAERLNIGQPAPDSKC